MPDFADIENLITICRDAHGIPEEKLDYNWSFSPKKKQRIDTYLEGINAKEIGTEEGTILLFQNFNQALHRTVKTGKIIKTANVIADILYWGGINGNKREKLESYARQLYIIDTLSDNGLKVAMEEFYYSKQDGIASWSKILAAWEPESFFIYDANVAAALQTLYAGRYRFFLPPSESKSVKKYYDNTIKKRGEDEQVDYHDYCVALQQTGNGIHLEKRLFMLGRRLTRQKNTE